ncbi:MAG: hypothetical protein IT440_15485 [Phycisphaeraceae bacterium]|nr:hypothetical protein [Phycisphaeraceae bacterium]
MIIDPLKNIGNLDARAVRRVFEFLRQTQNEIINAIEAARGFKQENLHDLFDRLVTVIEDFKKRYAQILVKEFGAAFATATKSTDKALKGAGIDLAKPLLTVDQVEIINQSLQALPSISKIYANVMPKVERVIGQAALGRFTLTESIAEIRGIFKTNAAYRSERLVRTEVSRALNYATVKRGNDADQVSPGIKKFWLHTYDKRTRPTHVKVGYATNPRLNGKPIAMSDKFDVGGFSANAPQDPSLPAQESIHCRCRLGFVVPQEKS